MPRTPQQQVHEFHTVFGRPTNPLPTVDVAEELVHLRTDLLLEEVQEFVEASQARDLVGIADALADIAYIVYGTAVTYGIDLDPLISEVHRSNMSKLDENGHPILRADGKVLKSSLYTPPSLGPILAGQHPLYATQETA